VPYRSGFGGADFCRVHQGLEFLPRFFPGLGKFVTAQARGRAEAFHKIMFTKSSTRRLPAFYAMIL
jgi:hypothetical protein